MSDDEGITPPWVFWILEADEERFGSMNLKKWKSEVAKPGGTRRKEMAARYLADNGRLDECRREWEIRGPAGEVARVALPELAIRRFI